MHNNAETQSSQNADIQYPHGKRPRNLKCEEQNRHLGIMGHCQQAYKTEFESNRKWDKKLVSHSHNKTSFWWEPKKKLQCCSFSLVHLLLQANISKRKWAYSSIYKYHDNSASFTAFFQRIQGFNHQPSLRGIFREKGMFC